MFIQKSDQKVNEEFSFLFFFTYNRVPIKTCSVFVVLNKAIISSEENLLFTYEKHSAYFSFMIHTHTERRKAHVMSIAQCKRNTLIYKVIRSNKKRCKLNKMDLVSDIFSNKSYLKKINKNFVDLIELIQSHYKPLPLISKEPLERKEISFEFLQEFNGSNSNQQIELLSIINDFDKLCLFLLLNPTSYDCQNFIEELCQLSFNSLLVKQHLGLFLFKDFIFKKIQLFFFFVSILL